MNIYVRIWDISEDLHDAWLAVFHYAGRRNRTQYLLIIDADWTWISAEAAGDLRRRRAIEVAELPAAAQRRLLEAAADLNTI